MGWLVFSAEMNDLTISADCQYGFFSDGLSPSGLLLALSVYFISHWLFSQLTFYYSVNDRRLSPYIQRLFLFNFIQLSLAFLPVDNDTHSIVGFLPIDGLYYN